MKEATRSVRRASTMLLTRFKSQTLSRESGTKSFITRFRRSSSAPTPSARTASDTETSHNVTSSNSRPETFDLSAVNEEGISGSKPNEGDEEPSPCSSKDKHDSDDAQIVEDMHTKRDCS